MTYGRRLLPSRVSLLAGAVVLVGLVAAACATGDDEVVRAEEAAETSLADASGSVTSFALENECDVMAEEFDIASEVAGEIDVDRDRGRLLLSSQGGGPPEAGALEQEHVWDGDTGYFRVAGFGWTEAAGADFATTDFVTFGLIPIDPNEQLGFLESVADPEATGDEVIRGVDTTGHAFEFSTHDLAAASGISSEMADELAADPAAAGEAEVWVDENGVARRLYFSVEFPEMPPDPAGTQSCTTDYFDFGVDVGDVLPTPDEVAASEDEMIASMTANLRAMYSAAGATEEESTCLAQVSGPDLDFDDLATREELDDRFPVDQWVGEVAECAPEDRLRLLHSTMVDAYLAGELPDPWEGLFPGE